LTAVEQRQPAATPVAPGEFDPLYRYLIAQSVGCTRPPVDRFRHSWLAPMPASEAAAAYLRRRQGEQAILRPGIEAALARPSTGDNCVSGDYSLGLFHHDASEAAIELLRYAPLREAASGSLLCLLDCAEPSGRVHRAELSHKSREAEPSKPVIAQFALRVMRALGDEGPSWLQRYRVLERVVRFIRFLEEQYTGLHGLLLTHSSLQSGFDSDLLTAGFPDKSVEGPDTNAFMVLEYRALGEMFRTLHGAAAAAEWVEKAEALADRMERLLWYEDNRGGRYVALRWVHGVGSLEGEIVQSVDPDGTLKPSRSWISFLPLYAGVPSKERAKRICSRLLDPSSYWGPWGIRTTPADDPLFHQARRVMLFDRKKDARGPVSNWSGPVWILSNYYIATGLAAYGCRAEARELAIKTARLLAQGLARDGALRECYDDSGRGLWPVKGTFISWNALALTLLREHCPEATAGWES
jgi:putative isomerase